MDGLREQLTFCNEAYRRDTLGTKYPWALGRPAAQVRVEIWPEISPRIDAVVRGGESTWDERLLLFLERSGYREEAHHTLSYGPLTGDDGRSAGLLCVVSEDTDRVTAERRMAVLRDLGADPTDMHPAAPASIAPGRDGPWPVEALAQGDSVLVGGLTRGSRTCRPAPGTPRG